MPRRPLTTGSRKTARGVTAVPSDRIQERQRYFQQYKEDVKTRGKKFFPYAMLHDTIMSLVVVVVIIGLSIVWKFSIPGSENEGTESGWLGKLYDDPANLFVAGFIGSPAMNLLHARLTDGGSATIAGHPIDVPVTAEDRSKSNGDVMIGIRPESFRIAENGQGIPVKVSVVEELGADAYVYGVAEDEDSGGEGLTHGKDVVIRVEARRTFDKGSTVRVVADPQDVHVFARESGERLGIR